MAGGTLLGRMILFSWSILLMMSDPDDQEGKHRIADDNNKRVGVFRELSRAAAGHE